MNDNDMMLWQNVINHLIFPAQWMCQLVLMRLPKANSRQTAFCKLGIMSHHVLSEDGILLDSSMTDRSTELWPESFNWIVTGSAWWRHKMETFSALLAISAGNSPVPGGEFPAPRPVTRSFDVFFDLRLNKRLSKQSRGCIWDATAPIMTSQ